jgi:hypothetical protein
VPAPSGILTDQPSFEIAGLQNKVFRTIGKFPKRKPVRNLYEAFEIPYVL